jgi:hypothetical protein
VDGQGDAVYVWDVWVDEEGVAADRVVVEFHVVRGTCTVVYGSDVGERREVCGVTLRLHFCEM